MISTGTHAAMLAILRHITVPGDVLCCEDITYPGILSIADHLQLRLIGIPSDAQGPDPAAIVKATSTTPIRALYLNPTIQNPTTRTITLKRRVELAV